MVEKTILDFVKHFNVVAILPIVYHIHIHENSIRKVFISTVASREKNVMKRESFMKISTTSSR